MPNRTESEWENNRRRLLKYFTPGADDECWLWRGSINPNGYGQFNRRLGVGNYTTQRAHRAVYEAVVGQIPEGLELDHLCRNRACVNPAHMEPVTRAENVARSLPYLARGNAHHHGAKTHCPQGHEYTPENTWVSKANRRYCLTCRAETNRKARDLRKNIGVTSIEPQSVVTS